MITFDPIQVTEEEAERFENFSSKEQAFLETLEATMKHFQKERITCEKKEQPIGISSRRNMISRF